MKTTLGTLVIAGKDLQLKQLTLDGGQVAVEGSITALHYEEPRESSGWFRRLLG
jgi:curli biogenesis system outer membrane secretion channel CsgG